MSGDESYANGAAIIDQAFAEAWGEVFAEEIAAEVSEAGTPGQDIGVPTPQGTPAVEPGGLPAVDPATGAEPPAPVPNAGELPGVQEVDPNAAPTGGPEGAGAAGSSGPPAAEPASPRPAFATVAPQFDVALKGINDKAEAQFRAKALSDVQADVAPEYLEHIQNHPRLLVGMTVPSISKTGETEHIRDEADARSWQEAVKSVLTRQVNQKADEYMTEAKPFLSTIQDSVEMFRQNPDLVPNTAEFNPELANRFVALAKSYEYRVDGRMMGYRVDVQPLITALRAQVQAAPAAPAAPPAPSAQQQRAAEQARNDAGQFDAPQAGIPSQAGHGGTAEEDYGAFWKTLGMEGMNI